MAIFPSYANKTRTKESEEAGQEHKVSGDFR